MSGGMEDGARLERRWEEIDRRHGGVCPHEEIDPIFARCTLCGAPVSTTGDTRPVSSSGDKGER